MLRRASLALLLAALLVAAAWAGGESSVVRVAVEIAPSAQVARGAPLPRVRIRASRLSSAATGGEDPREWEMDCPGEVAVALARDTGWRLAATAPGFWTPEAVLQAGEVSRVVFRMLPTGTIAGRIVMAPHQTKPSLLMARFQSAAGKHGPDVAVSSVSCPLDGERWECAVPAAILDLRLSAEGFVPRYSWGIDVRPGKRSDLGTVELARGASLIGRVEVDGSTPRGQVPVVEIVPDQMAGGVGGKAAAERIAERTVTTRPDERGFFQFTGITAGAYRITARLDGFATVSSPLATVRSGTETEIREPILLVRLLALEVQLHPRLDPYGQPWRWELLADPSELSPHKLTRAGQGMADQTGFLKKEDLAPGRFVLSVRDMTLSEWLREEIAVAPGKTALEFKLDLIKLEGKISTAGKPLEATLWWRKPQKLSRIRFDSDAGGVFAGFLPSEGEWWVDLNLPGGGSEALAPVEVKRAPGSAVARVEIRVPNTRLTVQVLDEQGKPVRGAEVIALGAREAGRTDAQLLSDELGEVVLRGLAPGTVRLYAHYRLTASEWVAHSVAEDVDEPPVPLVLREKVHLVGYVVASEGPVPGALVTVFPEPAAGFLVGRAVSDADGHFDVLLDPPFTGGSVAVIAPGFAARMMRAPPLEPSSPDLRVDVDQEAGAVLVDIRGLADREPSLSRLVHNGASMPLGIFLSLGGATRGTEGWVTLSMMEPGQYAFCAKPQDPPAACASGWLTVGSELRLGGGVRPPSLSRQPHPGDSR
ncbi:MAG TPA: carboxypeptidase-like regulatory domain-containing protein [Thermoanaerobaculia bacterium]|nr:carboxypeptidase-like regulatory domain-containing protein [Thermoanaerobaculia bacterium]